MAAVSCLDCGRLTPIRRVEPVRRRFCCPQCWDMHVLRGTLLLPPLEAVDFGRN